MAEIFTNYFIYSIILNTIGLFFSVFSVCKFFNIHSKEPDLIDRTTLRLQAALAMTDFVAHVVMYFPSEILSENFCQFKGFMDFYVSCVYLCITALITLNLHLNVLSINSFDGNKEKYLWYTIIIVPFLFNMPLYALGHFGRGFNGFCAINASSQSVKIILLLNVIIPNFSVFIYCLVIPSIILFKIKHEHDLLERIVEEHAAYDTESKSLLQEILDCWVTRLLLYPAAFVIVRFGLIIDYTFQSFSIKSEFLLYWATGGLCLSGLANYIAFINDPYYQSACQIIAYKSIDKEHFIENQTAEPDTIIRYELKKSIIEKEIAKSCDLDKNVLRKRHFTSKNEAEAVLKIRFQAF